MNRLLAIFLFLFICSNSFGQISVIGLWGTECEDGFFACQQIHFKTDSTFEYVIFMDVGGWNYMEGIWQMNKDTIILNTYNQPEERQNKIYNESSRKGSLLKLSLDSNIVRNIIVKVNENELVDTLFSNQSFLISEKITVRKITLINLDKSEDGIILFSDNGANIFEVFTLTPSITPKFTYLTNEKWFVRRNKIYYSMKNNGNFENYHYAKTNLKNKKFKLNN